MDPAEMKLFQENVEEFVMDEKKIVTFKYLACTLEISVNSAKRILREYVFPGGKRRSDVNITYVLGGQLLDNQGYKISLVREGDVPEEEKRFASVDLKEIFCVHQVESILDLNVIYGIDGNLHNVKPRVICKNAIQRAARPIPQISAPKPPVKPAPAPIIKETVKVPEQPATEAPKPAMASIFGNAAPKKSPVKNSNNSKQKKGGGITSFFAKQDKVVSDSKPQDSVKVESKIEEPSKEIKSEPSKAVTTTGSSKENSPKNESPPRKAKPSKTKTKRVSKEAVASKHRKRIMVMSDSDSSEGENSEREERCPSPEAPPPDFRAESSDEEVVPATPNTTAGGRKKVLLVKTTIDDEGYVVTTKEWGWEGDEVEAAAKVKNSVNAVENVGKKDEGKDCAKNEKDGRSSDRKKPGRKSEEIVNVTKKPTKEDKNEIQIIDSEDEKEKVEDEEEMPKNHKKEQKRKSKEKIEAKEEKVKATKSASKGGNSQAKKKEEINLDKSDSKTDEEKVVPKSTKASKDTKKAASKRKLIEVDSSEDEPKDKPSKEMDEPAAKRQPAKKPAVKKKSPPKGSGNQTNIMSFFAKK